MHSICQLLTHQDALWTDREMVVVFVCGVEDQLVGIASHVALLLVNLRNALTRMKER